MYYHIEFDNKNSFSREKATRAIDLIKKTKLSPQRKIL